MRGNQKYNNSSLSKEGSPGTNAEIPPVFVTVEPYTLIGVRNHLARASLESRRAGRLGWLARGAVIGFRV